MTEYFVFCLQHLDDIFENVEWFLKGFSNCFVTEFCEKGVKVYRVHP